jgi:SAM-dependent methyltransferase
MAAIEYPEYIARFYDTIYHQVRDGIDNQFFIDEMVRSGGSCLEIGVGTGRLFTDALERGVNVFGIDSSQQMTSVLLRKLQPADHYRIKTADAVFMKWDRKFDLVIAPFRVFSHITDTEDQIRLLNNINDHLTPKGKFIFDVFVPDPNLLAHGMNEVTDFDGEFMPGQKLKRTVNSVPDIVNQLLHVTMKLDWDENGMRKTASWSFNMRIFFRFELEHLIRLSNIRLDCIYGDYLHSSLCSDSRDFVVVCHRG